MPTIVLLHGLGRSARNMLIPKWRLQARGYRVCNIGYATRVASVEAAADAVHASLEQSGTDEAPVHFVTHSLGGLVLRALLSRHAVPGTGRAVMLAPPNAGSEIADRLRGSPWTRSILGPLADQLGTRSEDLPSRLPIPSIPFGVIAGDRWINPAGPLWLPAPHDGTVSVASTRLEGMADHIVLPYTHTFIMNPAVVADQIDAFLRQGRFLHPADPSPGAAGGPGRESRGGRGDGPRGRFRAG
jgi:pimeloyl-ACP methyl ester carboxylesterase